VRKVQLFWTRTIRIDGEEVAEGAYFVQHAGEHTLAEWCEILGRSASSVSAKAKREQVVLRSEVGLESTSTDKTYLGVTARTMLDILSERPVPCSEISRRLDRSTDTVRAIIGAMQDDGYCIEEKDRVVQNTRPAPEKRPVTFQDKPGEWLTFAIVSDTHGASKYAQWTSLHRFVRIAQEEFGVKHFLHAGDLTDGQQMYNGQVEEQYAHGVDEQVEDIVHNLPGNGVGDLDGIEWYVIGGNHDFKHYTLAGVNALRIIASKRPDINYVGQDAAELPLTDKADVRLWHPSGGLPYAKSYRAQKWASQLAFEELRRIIMGNEPIPSDEDLEAQDVVDATPLLPRTRVAAIGHLHVAAVTLEGAMTIFNAGCFQAQSPYLRKKGLYPQIGGWVVRLKLADDGGVLRVAPQWIPFQPIEDDWKCHYVPREASGDFVQRDPLFSLAGGG